MKIVEHVYQNKSIKSAFYLINEDEVNLEAMF